MKIKTYLIPSIVVGLILTLVYLKEVGAKKPEFVTICHAAGLDTTTHYITLTLPYNAVYGQAGHMYENGTTQAGHEQDYEGKCSPEVTLTLTPTESVTPSPDFSPTPTAGESATLTVTSSPTPTIVSSPTPTMSTDVSGPSTQVRFEGEDEFVGPQK